VQRELPTRFWFEAIVAGIGFALFLLTLITREWIEVLTGLDPDGGSGALEFGLAIGLLAVAGVSSLLARRTYLAATPA
jgi:nitrate reductase gamma subunit